MDDTAAVAAVPEVPEETVNELKFRLPELKETFIDWVPAASETALRIVVHCCQPPVAGMLIVPVSLTPLKWM